MTNLGPAVDTSSIVPSGHPNAGTSVDAAIDALGGSVSATPWDQERELEVGGLTAIRNANDPTDVLWSITQAREPGHRLNEVQVDNTTYPMTTGPIFDFVYDANHRIAVVEVSGSDIEYYLYTADGDLAAVYGRSGPQVFAYDGTQMIAALATSKPVPDTAHRSLSRLDFVVRGTNPMGSTRARVTDAARQNLTAVTFGRPFQ